MVVTEITDKIKNSMINAMIRAITAFRETSIILTIIGVSLLLSMLTPHFLTQNNLMTTAIGLSADGIMAIGMTIVLVSGGFDLSIGSIMGLSGVTAGALYLLGMNIWIACIIALLIGVTCGLINGYFIGKIGLNSLITTLAMMGIARGTAYVITQGSPLSIFNIPPSFAFIGSGKILGIPVIVIIFAMLSLAGDFMLRTSEPFRKVFYIGSNEKAAVLSGINTAKIKITVFLITATLASIAGILSLARFTVAAPTAGIGAELRVISAAVIGGASLNGGEGTVLGTVLGVILLNLINNGLILLNVSVYWQDLISGIFLIIAVTIDYVSHQNRTKNFNTVK